MVAPHRNDAGGDPGAEMELHAVGQSLDSQFRFDPQADPDALVEQLNCSRDRLDTIERLSAWKLDLQARLWREKQCFLFADTARDFGALADEVSAFRRVAKAYAWKGGAQR
jgi:hypothetical protein